MGLIWTYKKRPVNASEPPGPDDGLSSLIERVPEPLGANDGSIGGVALLSKFGNSTYASDVTSPSIFHTGRLRVPSIVLETSFPFF